MLVAHTEAALVLPTVAHVQFERGFVLPTQPPNASDALPLATAVTLEHLERRRQQRNMGGQAACFKQRELRAQRLERNLFQVDPTTTWPWQHVLRAQAPATRREIVGLGVTKFAFRLLRGV